MTTITRRAVAGVIAAVCSLTVACAGPDETERGDLATPNAVTPSAASSAAIASVDIGQLSTSDGAALPEGEPVKVNCTVNGLREARWKATFADGTTAQVDVTLPPQESGQAVWQQVPFGSGFLMAILPGDVEDIDVVADVPSDRGSYAVAAGDLRAIDSTCLTIRFDVPADAATVQGVVWRTSGGGFRNGNGGIVTSAEFSVAGDQIRVYYDPTLDVFGALTSSGTAISYRPGKTRDPFPCVLFSTTQVSGSWQTFFVGVLPAGSTGVTMRFLPSASTPSLQTLTAESGEVFVMAQARTATARGEIFGSVAFTDQHGKTVKPKWR